MTGHEVQPHAERDPEDPVEPEDPEDPEDPVDPEDPEDPVAVQDNPWAHHNHKARPAPPGSDQEWDRSPQNRVVELDPGKGQSHRSPAQAPSLVHNPPPAQARE